MGRKAERETGQRPWEQEITDRNRLVARNFQYGSSEIAADVVRGVDMVDNAGHRYSGYPAKGLQVSSSRFRTLGSQLPEMLIGTPGHRPPYFVDHPGRYTADGLLYSGAQNITTLTPNDTIPIHPFLEAMATKSKRGVITGPGYYWRLGPNETFDPVVIRLTADGKAQLLTVKGNDKRDWVLPGGDKEKGEEGLSGAAREAAEETGVDLRGKPAFFVRRGIPVGDWRATANAWPETAVYLYVIDERTSNQPNQTLRAQESEVERVAWRTMSRQGIEGLSFSHPSLVKLAVLELERQMGVVIDKNGKVGKAKS